jgi:hypothetical protein
MGGAAFDVFIEIQLAHSAHTSEHAFHYFTIAAATIGLGSAAIQLDVTPSWSTDKAQRVLTIFVLA